MEKITLITASYNSAKTIEDTIRSVEAQTYKNIEYLIIDGASKDNTMEVVNSMSFRVTGAYSESDKGIYDAYNKGLDKATGGIVGFINSDDFYCSNTVIERVMKAFEDSSVEAVYADLVYVEQDNTEQILRYWKSKPYQEGAFSKGFVPAHPTLFLRRSVYEKAGGFDLNYKLAADYEFMLRIFHKHKVKSKYIPDIFVKMRAGGATGESFSAIKRQNKEITDALNKYDVRFSNLMFFVRKTLNRSLQRFRAFFVKLPQEV